MAITHDKILLGRGRLETSLPREAFPLGVFKAVPVSFDETCMHDVTWYVRVSELSNPWQVFRRVARTDFTPLPV